MVKTEPRPDVSVVTVIYNVPREAPRTLFSLSAEYQRQIKADEYEVIVVDNGSRPPLNPKTFEGLSGNFRFIRVEDAPPSPGTAINRGLAEARGDIIGVMVDGARIVTPGLLHFARHGARLYEKALVATLNWHLGSDFQGWAIQGGYNQKREDELLQSINWKKNGYRLFEIGTPDESSVDGWFQPLAESNAFFARREVWDALGGVDERFNAPGGGLINLDTFCRALELPEAELVILLAEATFHQVHGGTSSNAPPENQIANWLRWANQYERIRGRPYRLVRAKRPPTYLGTLPRPALARLVRAALYPSPMHPERPLGEPFNKQLWTTAVPAKPSDQTIAALIELAQNEFRHERLTAACAVARLIRQRAPEEPEPQRILSLVAPWLRPDGPAPIRRPNYHLALAQAHRILGEDKLAATHYRNALAFQPPYAGPRLGHYLGGSWSMHLAFVYEIMRELKPALFVQLGIGRGESYFAFCQSVAEHRLETKCHGIDAPLDDSPADESEVQMPGQLNERYSSFSTLKTMSLTTAAAGFEDGSVDLLHLNSAHSYEEVKAAFRAWLPKLSHDGVALLHDVVPREYGSGLWKLWDEIARAGASFVFTFDGSLGVWRKRKGSERDPAWLRRLFGADDLERKRINDSQAIAASALALWHAGEESNSGAPDPLQIRLVIDQEGGGTSWTKEVAGEGLQSIRFERIGPAGSARRCTLQIDAVDHPVFITLFSITIARERDGTILYHGESVADFEEIQVRGALLDQRESGTLQLLASGAESQIILPAIDLPQGDSYYLEVSLEPSRARFDHEISEIDVSALPTENVLRMDVFHSVAEGYRDTECQTRYFARGCWQLLALDVPARDKISELPLRIDPATAPAVIEVAQVRLTRPGTNEILWTAQTPEEFNNFQVAGTASRLPHDNHLRILSFGDDPQLLLPSSTIALNNEPLRFEILLLVDPNGDTVRQCLASTKPRAGEATSEDVTLYLGLSADEETAGDEGISLQAPLRMDERQIVRFENIESLSRAGDNRLKIGPLYRPAYLKISRIVITRDLDGLVLYRADSEREFEKIEVAEGAEKQLLDGSFTFTANDSQQIYLPSIDLPAEGSCRLEIEIEPYSAPSIRQTADVAGAGHRLAPVESRPA